MWIVFGLTVQLSQHDESVFPVHPGSHLRPTNPALEFVKALTKVLSLDPAIEAECAKLRRDLLRLVGVGEFEDRAGWVDPCVSFVLPEVTCRHCNHCRDLDLCRDPHVVSGDGPGPAAWTCAGADCGAAYDSDEIEHQLVDALQRKTMGFVLQACVGLFLEQAEAVLAVVLCDVITVLTDLYSATFFFAPTVVTIFFVPFHCRTCSVASAAESRSSTCPPSVRAPASSPLW